MHNTHTLTYMCTDTYTYIPVHSHTYTHTCTHTCTYICTHIHMHTYIHIAHTQRHANAPTRAGRSGRSCHLATSTQLAAVPRLPRDSVCTPAPSHTPTPSHTGTNTRPHARTRTRTRTRTIGNVALVPPRQVASQVNRAAPARGSSHSGHTNVCPNMLHRLHMLHMCARTARTP